MYNILSAANMDILTFCFPILMHFISSFPLITLASTSSTKLNKSGEIRHVCLVSVVRGYSFSFSSFSMILAISWPYIGFMILSYGPSIPNSWSFFFLTWMCVEVCQLLPSDLLRWSYAFCSSFCLCDLWYSLIG